MTISFRNTEGDFLEYHLFSASHSKTIMRRRNASRYMFAVIYSALGIYCMVSESVAVGMIFITVGILWFFLFPKLTAASSRKFYTKYIAENYKARMEKTTTLSFSEDGVLASDESTQVKTSLSEIGKLIEANRCFFLKMENGSAFIIPKDQTDGEELKRTANRLQIPIESKPDWRWK